MSHDRRINFFLNSSRRPRKHPLFDVIKPALTIASGSFRPTRISTISRHIFLRTISLNWRLTSTLTRAMSPLWLVSWRTSSSTTLSYLLLLSVSRTCAYPCTVLPQPSIYTRLCVYFYSDFWHVLTFFSCSMDLRTTIPNITIGLTHRSLRQ